MEKTTQVDGLKICYLEEGSGPAVIFLHGASLGSSARAFERNLPVIGAAGFRAIAYDQPGFGLSDNPNDYTASYRTSFIPKFIDAIGADRAALVGHSQAAGMAVRVALAPDAGESPDGRGRRYRLTAASRKNRSRRTRRGPRGNKHGSHVGGHAQNPGHEFLQ